MVAVGVIALGEPFHLAQVDNYPSVSMHNPHQFPVELLGTWCGNRDNHEFQISVSPPLTLPVAAE